MALHPSTHKCFLPASINKYEYRQHRDHEVERGTHSEEVGGGIDKNDHNTLYMCMKFSKKNFLKEIKILNLKDK